MQISEKFTLQQANIKFRLICVPFKENLVKFDVVDCIIFYDISKLSLFLY